MSQGAVSQPLVHCVTTPCLLLLSRYNHLYRGTPLCARCIATQNVAPSHDTIFVSRLNPLARPHARALPPALARSRPCRGLPWSSTTCQIAEYSWMSGNPTPLSKIGQSLLCTGSSTQNTTCPNHMATCPNVLQRPHRVHIQLK